MRRILAFVTLFLLAIANPGWAFTITFDRAMAVGNQWAAQGRFTFDTSYPTGGESAAIADVTNNLMTSLFLVLIETRSGYTFAYDYSNFKVQAYRSAAISAHTHTVSDTLASHTHTVTATNASHSHSIAVANTSAGTAMTYSAGAVNVNGNSVAITTNSQTPAITTTPSSTATTLEATTSSDAATAAAALSEVANATNLSAVTNVRYMAYGL